MRVLILIFFVLLSESVYAHQSSNSYLTLDVKQQNIEIRWDIALRDLQNVINIDINSDGKIQWNEVKKSKMEVFSYSLARLKLTSDSVECALVPANIKINERSDGFYAVLYASSQCKNYVDELDIDYQLFFELDAQHRGLVKVNSSASDISFAFSPEINNKKFFLNEDYRFYTFFRFVSEGIWHIWIGFDHILFLLSLLLPAVLLRYRQSWLGILDFPTAMVEVFKIVTAFTIAHSLTLSLVMLGKISLPVMLVESVIAFSVLVAALNNLYPVVSQKRWLLGFIFGLIHGFGFANVLAELDLGSSALFATLLGFNVGVELGQLAIVVIFMPIAFKLRNGWLYRKVIFKLGSVSIASIGFMWLIERAM